MICCVSCVFQRQSAALFFKVRAPSVFSAILKISNYSCQLSGCTFMTGMWIRGNACCLWENWFWWLTNLSGSTEGVCPLPRQRCRIYFFLCRGVALRLPEDRSTPLKIKAEYLVQISELLLFSPHSHSGIVGKVSSVSVLFYHDHIFYGPPAVLFRLVCLSQLSTVEKDTDIETYKKKKNTRTHCSLQNNPVVGAVCFGGQ